MKKLITVAVLLAAVTSVYAQRYDFQSEPYRRQLRKRIMNAVMNAVPHTPAQKPTTEQQRLIAIKLDDNINNPPLELEDTTRIYYSGLRASTFNYGTLEYNTNLYSLDGPVAEGLSILPAYADELSPDSLTYEIIGGYNEKYVINYLNGSLKNHLTLSSDGGSQQSYAVTYDNSNYITNVEYKSENQPPHTLRTIKYNASYSRVTSDSLYYVGTNNLLPDLSLWNYTYDVNDRITMLEYYGVDSVGSTIPYSKYVFTYYPDLKLKSLMAYVGTEYGNYEPDYYDSFSYEGNNPIFKGQYSQDYIMGGEPALASAEIKHFNSIGLPDSVYFYVTSPINPTPGNPVSFAAIDYNDFRNPISKRYYEMGANYAFRIYKYYYEAYETSVDELANGQRLLNIYPNPAGQYFSLEWAGPQPIKNARISILDNQGRLLQKITRTLNAGTNTFPADKLIPGNYLIMVQNENGQQIVKKLTRLR